jgi:predicted type IV restriction endonuclease
MPLNEIPKYLTPEVRSLIEAKLSKDGTIEAAPARNKLRSTMVALASVGETDHRKLKWFAIHAWRGALQAQQSSSALHARMNGTAAETGKLIVRCNHQKKRPRVVSS